MSPENKDPFERLLKNHLAASPSAPLAEPCPDENWTAAYLEGSLNATFRATFERHLAHCRRCQAELASLLKAAVVEAEAKPGAAPAASSQARGLLATLLHWTKAPVFRPAFAVLLVSVVTGVVGYRVLRDERILEQRPADAIESAKRSSETVVGGRSRMAGPAEATQAPQQKQLRSESTSTDLDHARRQLDAPQDSWNQREAQVADDKANFEDREKKDAAAAQPSSEFAPEPNAAARPARGDATGLPLASPEPSQKESLVASRDTSELKGKMEEGAAKPVGQAMPAAPPPPPPPALGAMSKAKVGQESLADEKDGRLNEGLGGKKQGMAESSRMKMRAASANMPRVSRIEAGGKRFDLIDNVWRDASILSSDTSSPTLITADSAEFESLSKRWAPYQAVLSRPEDVLIKLDGRLYRIRKLR